MTEEKDVKMSETAKKVSEVLGDLQDDAKSESGFSKFLKELDVSKKQFFTFVVVLIVFVAVVVYSFFAVFNLFKPESEELDFRQEEKIEISKESEKSSKVVEGYNKVLEVPLSVNQDAAKVNLQFDFLRLPLKLGAKTSKSVDLDYYARVFSEMKLLYEVDVYAYLDNFDDRSKALKDYIKKTEAGISNTQILLADLKREVAVLEKSLDALEQKAKDSEKQFFDASDNLRVGKIDENLLLFQSLNIRIAELKPLLKGRLIFVKRFEDVLELVPEKLVSVKANSAALIKAVKLQNVNDFDLNLIEP